MTRQIQVGNVKIGGGAPVVIQSMLNTKTTDVAASLEQIRKLQAAGCQIVRLSVQNMEAARGFAEIAEASQTAMLAFLNLLSICAFIAINLAVMNLLPIPALDGGRIVALLITVVIERIIRKKIDPKYEGYIHAAGMILLLGLMAVIMFKDIFVIFKG